CASVILPWMEPYSRSLSRLCAGAIRGSCSRRPYPSSRVSCPALCLHCPRLILVCPVRWRYPCAIIATLRTQSRSSPRAHMSTDRNLLFGVLALQADFIDKVQFAEACSAWAARKETPLADLLVERGWLSAEDRADVEKLLARKLAR